jgi:Aminotransferase class I and II
MDVRPFRIERYYARYEFTTRYMLSSSDCESRTIESLLDLEPDAHARLISTWCGYTESPGAPELRAAIAGLYERIDPDEVIVTSCAEEGIFLLHHALLPAGAHAIVETPCYESALELARSTGAEVSPWHPALRGWLGPRPGCARTTPAPGGNAGALRQLIMRLKDYTTKASVGPPGGWSDRVSAGARRRGRRTFL